MRLTLLLLLIPFRLFAPVPAQTFILSPEPINIYKPLFKAVCEVESGNDITAVNWRELAHGPAQIRPIRILDYNKRTGKNYTVSDCLNYSVSWEVFRYYARGKDFERAAKNWNGSGRLTIDYWERVKKQINS